MPGRVVQHTYELFLEINWELQEEISGWWRELNEDNTLFLYCTIPFFINK